MRFINMSDYNRAAKAYWFALVGVGTLVGAWALSEVARAFTLAGWAQFVVLLSLVLISTSRPIRIPGTVSTVTVGDAFTFLGVIFLGVPAAVLLGVADSLAGTLRSSKRATSWLISPAVMGLAVFLSGNVFYFALNQTTGQIVGTVGTRSPFSLSQLLVPLVSMALAQYATNGALVAAFSAIKSRRSVWECWRDGYLWTFFTFVAAAITAGLVYEAIRSFGLLYVTLSVPVIAATYATYKTYFDRVNEKTREAAEMSRIHLATVEALATAIDAKDQTTHCHVRRVQLYTARMGELMGLSAAEIKALSAGALLHDVGKLAVPDHILNKPGKLTAAEFERMKIHTVVGAEILERVGFPYPVVPIVRSHHERWDGLGYPDNLSGEKIPITARVLAVVDCFDSAREDRPYRPGLTVEAASALLQRGAGTHFDPRVVEMFLRHLPEFEQEVAALGLNQHGFTSEECEPRALVEEDFSDLLGATTTTTIPLAASSSPHHVTGTAGGDAHRSTPPQQSSSSPHSSQPPSPLSTPPAYLDQIKNAHREVYALYEIARTFGSSLDVEETISVLVNKVGHIVPFDTCVVYLYDEEKTYAIAAHVAGLNSAALAEHCVGYGEGAVGFVLANRLPAINFNPALDFASLHLPDGAARYKSMAALPLVKDERLIGALAVYSLEAGRYTDDHARLLETIARLASDALSNAMNHAQAESNALTDTLTGLPNARAMFVRFEQEAARARRTRRPFQVVMLDLDGFKLVNDTFGHKTGDQMLREVARLLQAQLREYDFLARYAGDEFVALVQDTSAEQVEELIGRIEKTIAGIALRVRPNEYAHVGISVGAAGYGTHGETLDQLLIAADEAMYTVKSDHKKQPNPTPHATAANATGSEQKSLPTIATGDLASTAIN